MGMPISLALRGRHADGRTADRAWAACLAQLREVDRVFSPYRSDSYVSRLSSGAIGVDACPAVVGEVLALGERARVESGGAFNIRRPGPHHDPVLDPSGVVKGWAVDRAAALFRSLDDTDFCLSAGGDMVCHVAAEDRPEWRVGVEDPHDPDRLVAVVPVRRGAVATSGHAHRGRHVVDARTGGSPARVASVTVVHGELTWADIDATAAYALGPEAATWLRTRLVVWEDGSHEVVSGPR
jgi:thiamine biosynthesis lipoprotein